MTRTQEIVLRPSVCCCSPCSQPRWERGNEAGVIRGPIAVASTVLSNPEHYRLESALTCYSVYRNGTRGKQDGRDGPGTGSAHCKDIWVWTLQGHFYVDLSLLRFLTITKKITDKTCRLETLKILRKNRGSWRDWAVVKSTCHLIIKIRVQTLTPKSGCSQTLVTQLQGIWCPLLALTGTYTHTRRWRTDINRKKLCR